MVSYLCLLGSQRLLSCTTWIFNHNWNVIQTKILASFLLSNKQRNDSNHDKQDSGELIGKINLNANTSINIYLISFEDRNTLSFHMVINYSRYKVIQFSFCGIFFLSNFNEYFLPFSWLFITYFIFFNFLSLWRFAIAQFFPKIYNWGKILPQGVIGGQQSETVIFSPSYSENFGLRSIYRNITLFLKKFEIFDNTLKLEICIK